MLIAGFPCQTFSVIGRKEGFSDNNVASHKKLEILSYYLNNPTNSGKYSVDASWKRNDRECHCRPWKKHKTVNRNR